ncbi:MAG: HNH endonuclease [Gammaproteobacteria bacterium]|nr:HNH endonuclease [Gammaproteobacteria bacterium]
MVKNNILHEANRRTEFFEGGHVRKLELWNFDEDSEGYWAREIGRGFNRRPRIDVLLNHWLTFQSRRITRHYREFETFRKYSKSERDRGLSILDVARDLRDVAKLYREIDECTIEEISPFLRRCRVMNLGAVTPLLFWLLTNEALKGDEPVLSKCITTLDSFFVRRAVCGFHTRVYAKISERLMGILDESCEPADQVLIDYLGKQDALGEIWPTDEEFEKRFLEAPLYYWIAQGRLRMVLLAIEEQLHTKHSEVGNVLDAGSLQIEHIMPVSWHAHWPLPESESPESLQERRESLLHTIGNLTLVKASFNSVLSNREWTVKKNAFEEHSVLFLNRELVSCDSWDEDRIRARSARLFEQARSIWPRPSSVRESN